MTFAVLQTVNNLQKAMDGQNFLLKRYAGI